MRVQIDVSLDHPVLTQERAEDIAEEIADHVRSWYGLYRPVVGMVVLEESE